VITCFISSLRQWLRTLILSNAQRVTYIWEEFYIKRLLLFIICFIISLSPAYATVEAYNIHVNEKYVYATAKCSCSLSSDYKYHTRVFYNYDPISNKYGVLSFEDGPAPYTSPEANSLNLILSTKN
jgi:hypothetical protein